MTLFALSENSPNSYYAIRNPNAFTPNNDGNNDYYRILFTGISARYFSLNIFDKNGNRLYTTTDTAARGWDGKNSSVELMPPDRYRAEIVFNNTGRDSYTTSYCIALLDYSGGICIPVSYDGKYLFEDMYAHGGFNGPTKEAICY